VFDDGVQSGTPDAQEIWTQTSIEVEGKPTRVSLIEIHRKGTITYRITDGKVDYPVADYFPELANSIDMKLEAGEHMIIHIKNSGSPLSIWGTSDYADIEGLIYEVDNRTSRIAATLDKHSSPKLRAPKGTMDKIAKGGTFDVFETMPSMGNDDVKIEYIQWDGKLEAAYASLDSTIDMMLNIANVSPSLIGRDKSGGNAESGRALKFKLIRTLAMKHRKEMYWTTGLRQLLWTLQKLSSTHGYTISGEKSLEPVMPTIQFKDSVITDLIESIELIERQLGAGLISKVEAMQEFHHIERDIAEKRLKEIQAEDKLQTSFSREDLTDNDDVEN